MSVPPNISQPTWINWNSPVKIGSTDSTKMFRKVTDIYGGNNMDTNKNLFGYSNDNYFVTWIDANNYTEKNTSKVYLENVQNPQYLWSLKNVTSKDGKKNTNAYAIAPNPNNPASSNLDPSAKGLYYHCNSQNTIVAGINYSDTSGNGQGVCMDTMKLDDAVNNNDGNFFNNNWCYGNNLTGYMAFHDKRSGGDMDSLLQSNPSSTFNVSMDGFFTAPNFVHASGQNNICTNIDTNASFKMYNGSLPGRGPTISPTQLIDEENAIACCSLTSTQASSPQFPMCSQAFNPSTDNIKSLCVPLMTDTCKNYWADTTNKNVCQTFIGQSPAGPTFVRTTIQNYLTDPSRVPQDYVSSYISKNDPASLSSQYYNYFTNGQKLATYTGNDLPLCKYDPNNLNGNNDSPFASCSLRNDVNDPFFKQGIPSMINQLPNASSKATIDDTLNCYCAAHTRGDIEAETNSGQMTLMNVCGCHLVSSGNTSGNVSCPSNLSSNRSWNLASQQDDSQYYIGESGTVNGGTVGGPQCDPMCINATVQNQNFGGKCDSQICMIDNVNYTCVNSKNCGDINISQNCAGGSCYISDVTIETINGSNSGGINLQNDCNTCYSFSNNNITNSTPIDCKTGLPIGGGGGSGGNGGGGSGGGGGNGGGGGTTPSKSPFLTWVGDHKWESVGLVLLFAILFGLLVWASIAMLDY